MVILIFVFTLVLAYLLAGEIFNLLSKLFKLEGANFKKSLIIILSQGIIAGIISILLGIFIHSGQILLLINLILGFIVLHYVLYYFYHNGWLKSFEVWISFFIITFILSTLMAVSVRAFIAEPFSVSGDSMNPIYQSGDYLLVSKWPTQYSRGNVIVLKDPQNPTTYLIKRIIGLPGETITIADDQVSINGTTVEPYSDGAASTTSLLLGNNQYYVLGDNPSDSLDSRTFGAVNKSEIIGKVFYKLYPFTQN